jgi:hypothetical protein
MQPHPASVTRRGATYVYGHVEYFSRHDPDQLALGLLELIVKAAQDIAGRAGVIVLYEISIHAGGVTKHTAVVALQKKPPVVAEYAWLDDQHLG